jgi:HEAT repeat protein
VGQEASLALGKIGKPAVDKLIASLNDSRGHVRCNAIMSLGLIGDARAGGPLAGLLANADREVRRDAAKALGALGDRAAVETLIRAATDRDARESLQRMVDVLVVELESEDSGTREIASEYLGKIEDRHAAPHLIKRLSDDDTVVRENASRALGNLWDPSAVGLLVLALRDKNSLVRAYAAGRWAS